MGTSHKILTWVGSGQPSLVWVRKISPKNHNFQIFDLRVKKISSGQIRSKSTQVKDGSDSYLLRVKSMLGSGQAPSLLSISDGSGLKKFWPRWDQFFIAWVRSGRVSHLWFGFGKFSLKIPKIFNFFPFGLKKSHRILSKSTRVKDGLASYLLRVKSMLGSG